MNPQDVLDAIQRLKNAASGDKPKRGSWVVGAIAGARAGAVAAHASYPWPTADWQDADGFDDGDWDDYADEAEAAVSHALWPPEN